jgi:hypothetical protein
MGHVEVIGATVSGGRIERLKVKIPNIPVRTIDRDTAIQWLRDGHSLIPVVGGVEQPALRLADVEDVPFIRQDTANAPEDTLPELPSA